MKHYMKFNYKFSDLSFERLSIEDNVIFSIKVKVLDIAVISLYKFAYLILKYLILTTKSTILLSFGLYQITDNFVILKKNKYLNS